MKTDPHTRIAEAQEHNARLYRQYERRAPWNSKTRQGWKELADSAESCARHHRNLAPVFYEVNLSDCDGCNATLHVWNNGNVERVAGTPYAVRKLLPLWHDPESPAWVRETIARRFPSLALAQVSPLP